MATRRLDDMDAGDEALRQRELESYEEAQRRMSENIAAELGTREDESKKKTTPMFDIHCPAFQNYKCFFKGGQGICNQFSRNKCELWKQYGKQVQKREYTTEQLEKARVEMRRGQRESQREIMRIRGSYKGYFFSAESWGNE